MIGRAKHRFRHGKKFTRQGDREWVERAALLQKGAACFYVAGIGRELGARDKSEQMHKAKERIMPNIKIWSLAAAMVCGVGTACAQSGSPENSTVENSVNKVTEPFDGREVPEKLLAIQDDPYSMDGMTRCANIIQEVEELNAVLGPDVHERIEKTRDQKRGATVGRVASSFAGSIIPFRSLIGEVTGANAERRRYAEAVYAGTVRRGFLKGVGLERGCKAPARP